MSLLDMVFGCWHQRCTFPITVRGKLRSTTTAAAVTGIYVVCLNCGREFPCDWSQMKMLASRPPTGWAPKRATHHSRPQSGLRPVPGASRSLYLRIRSVERSCCFLGGQRNSRSLN